MLAKIWRWISDPSHQKTLAFIGGGLVAVVAAGWQAYVYFNDAGGGASEILAQECGFAGGRDVNVGGDITCNFGISLEEYEAGLERREAEIRAELESLNTGDDQQRASLQADLAAVRTRLANVEAAYEERRQDLLEVAQALAGLEGASADAEDRQRALLAGDAESAEAPFSEALASGKARAANAAYHLGLLRASRRDFAGAYAQLEQAVALAPDNAQYRRKLAAIAEHVDGANLEPGRLRMRAVLGADGEPVKACHYVYEAAPNLDGERKRITYSCEVSASFELAPGRYRVRSEAGSAGVNADVAVLPEAVTDQRMNLEAGRVRMTAVLGEGGEPVKACHYVYEAKQDLDGNRRQITYSCTESAWFTLPAGRYYLWAKAGNANAGRETEVGANALTDHVTDLNAGRLRMTAVLGEGAEPVKACHYVYEAKQDLDGNRRQISYSCTESAWFTLPAGRYYLWAKSGNANAGREAEVGANAVTDHVTDLNAGRVRMTAVLDEGGEPVNACHYVYEAKQDLDGNRREISRSCKESAWFTLPAGRYYLWAKSGNANAGREAEVGANAVTDHVTDLDAGRLRMVAVPEKGADPVDACHYVYDPKPDLDGNRERISYACSKVAWFTLPAGRYYLWTKVGETGTAAEIEVHPNEVAENITHLGT